MISEYVKLSIKNKVGYIEFFHPSSNALPSNTLIELKKAIDAAAFNDAIQVIVLQSGGNRTFCAGASFNDIMSIENAQQGEVFFSGFAHVINAMRKCSKLIIGRIQGKAIGGGVGLIAATDYCLATSYASVRLSELSLGLGPFVIEPVVTRKVGLAAMSQMTLNAETFFTATWAKEKGLYAELYDNNEELDQATITLAETLSRYNPEALKQIKLVFWEGTQNWDTLLVARAKLSGSLILSNFTKDALKRFR